jgi:hypothetical protein
LFGLPALLAFGGLFFWAFVAIMTVVLIIAVDREKPAAASGWIILTLVALTLLGNGYWWTWILENPIYFLYGVLAYLAIGIVWTFGKWYFFLLNAADYYAGRRAAWMEKKGLKVIKTDDEKEELRNHISTNLGYSKWAGQSFPPQPSDNVSSIFIWLMYWPFSLLWTLINDPVRRVGMFIYRRIQDALAGLSRRTFNKFNEFD